MTWKNCKLNTYGGEDYMAREQRLQREKQKQPKRIRDKILITLAVIAVILSLTTMIILML
jgi:hypothetical protein